MSEWHRQFNGWLSASVYDAECKVNFTSTLIRKPEGDWIVDPFKLTDELIEGVRHPQGILITSGNHERASWELSQRWNVPIWAPREAQAEFVHKPHHLFEAGDEVAGLQTIPILGAGPGEVAYYDGKGSLVVGDALTHLVTFDLLPRKYCSDFDKMIESLGALLELPRIDNINFAHGACLWSHPYERLEKLLIKGGSLMRKHFDKPHRINQNHSQEE
jgi:hypothetical protein